MVLIVFSVVMKNDNSIFNFRINLSHLNLLYVKDGGLEENRTLPTMLARHHRPLGTCEPIQVELKVGYGDAPSGATL